MNGISLRQFARLLGVSDTAVRKAEKRGVFSQNAVRREGEDVLVLDVGLAVGDWERSGRLLRGSRPSELEQKLDQLPARFSDVDDREGPPALRTDAAPGVDDADPNEPAGEDSEPGPAKGVTLVEAQRLAMLERGRRLKLDNDLKEGLLIEAERASREAFEFARVLREAILNVPGRIAAELAGETDAARIHVLLETALRSALETTAATFDAPVTA